MFRYICEKENKRSRERHKVDVHNTSLFHSFEKGLDMSENMVIPFYLLNMIMETQKTIGPIINHYYAS